MWSEEMPRQLEYQQLVYSVFLLQNYAPAHRSGLVKDVLTNNNVTTLEHRPYFSDLAAADFFPFPRLKSAPKGRRCCDATDIENATEELKMLSQNGFQECLQHLQSLAEVR